MIWGFGWGREWGQKQGRRRSIHSGAASSSGSGWARVRVVVMEWGRLTRGIIGSELCCCIDWQVDYFLYPSGNIRVSVRQVALGLSALGVGISCASTVLHPMAPCYPPPYSLSTHGVRGMLSRISIQRHTNFLVPSQRRFPPLPPACGITGSTWYAAVPQRQYSPTLLGSFCGTWHGEADGSDSTRVAIMRCFP